MEGADGTETQFLLDTNCTLLGIPYDRVQVEFCGFGLF